MERKEILRAQGLLQDEGERTGPRGKGRNVEVKREWRKEMEALEGLGERWGIKDKKGKEVEKKRR